VRIAVVVISSGRVRLDGPADLARQAAGGLEDREPTRFSIRLDVMGAQLRKVIVHARNREFLVGQEAVAPRRTAGRDSQDLHRRDLGAEEGEQPAHRPHEDPIPGAPPHRLRERQRRDRAGNDLG